MYKVGVYSFIVVVKLVKGLEISFWIIVDIVFGVRGLVIMSSDSLVVCVLIKVVVFFVSCKVFL